jgi:predicted nucleic acid-binding protein
MKDGRAVLSRFANPLYVNNLIDANFVDHIAGKSWEPIRHILELYAAGEIQLIIPHSVLTELLSHRTPAAVRAVAQEFIFTIPTSLTVAERIQRDRLLQRAKGNAELKNIAADLSHVAEASKYGGYFITLDERLLKRAAVISDMVGVEVVTPEHFIKRVAEAKVMNNEGRAHIFYKLKKTGKIMQDIDSFLQKLQENGDVNKIRNELAELFIHLLESVKESLGYWEKFHFSNAIRMLRANISLINQPRTLWLRAFIKSLDNAFIPAAERNENYMPRDKEIDSLTYEQLMEAIESIRNSS